MKHILIKNQGAISKLNKGAYLIDTNGTPSMTYLKEPKPYRVIEGEIPEPIDYIRSHKKMLEHSLPYDMPYLSFFWFFTGNKTGISVMVYIKCHDETVAEYFSHVLP